MKNDQGQFVDLYIPRKCSASKKLINANEHGSVQINLCQVDDKGVATSEVVTLAMCEQLRKFGTAESKLSTLLKEAGVVCTSITPPIATEQ